MQKRILKEKLGVFKNNKRVEEYRRVKECFAKQNSYINLFVTNVVAKEKIINKIRFTKNLRKTERDFVS